MREKPLQPEAAWVGMGMKNTCRWWVRFCSGMGRDDRNSDGESSYFLSGHELRLYEQGNYEKAKIYISDRDGTETESGVADDRLLTDSAGKYLLAARRHNQVRRGQLEEALFGPQMLT